MSHQRGFATVRSSDWSYWQQLVFLLILLTEPRYNYAISESSGQCDAITHQRSLKSFRGHLLRQTQLDYRTSVFRRSLGLQIHVENLWSQILFAEHCRYFFNHSVLKIWETHCFEKIWKSEIFLQQWFEKCIVLEMRFLTTRINIIG